MADRRALAGWCLFDWANQGYPTVIQTFVFATYFTQAVAESPVEGTSLWGTTLSLSGILVILLSPPLGAISDRGGRRKPWLAVLSLLCLTSCGLLWFTRPDPASIPWALLFLVLSGTLYELVQVFYNAMLPDIAPADRLGRISGWGWATGYAGGIVCLLLLLFAFIQTDHPLFGLDKAAAEHVRVSALVVAGWWLLFSWPLFAFVPDRTGSGLPLRQATREGLATLWHTLRHLRDHANIARFLVARMLYNDGLVTIFAFGAIYAAGTFGFDTQEIILFGIGLNVTAGLGAFAFAWIDDAIGSKRTITLSIVAIMAIGSGLLVIDDAGWFWGLGLALGVFFGPVQSASRAMLARLSPPEVAGEMFGLYALSGKAISFLGPAVLALATDLTGSQRVGMATPLIFFASGLALLLTVRERRP